jgi:hypothetical protein
LSIERIANPQKSSEGDWSARLNLLPVAR